MARGDTERGFAQAAEADGIELTRQSFRWLNQQGHLGLPIEGDSPDQTRALLRARETLEQIYTELGGDLDVLKSGRSTSLRGDFVHEPTGTLIEVDESQHFTSARLLTLECYPADVPLGFDLEAYKNLCRQLRVKSDGYYRTKSARGFGTGGRQKQRAYYDALRDLAVPAMGHPPLIRIEAAQRDATDSYKRHRDRLMSALKPAFRS